MSEQDPNQALTEAMRMMTVPMNQLPPIALEYAKDLCRRGGGCMETFITAYAAYNQVVLGMPCSDDLYIVPDDEREWFVRNGYAKEA